MHELDVRSVVLLVELVGAGVEDDHRPALLHERRAPVEVEEVALRHHLHEQRVQERVHVVRADVRDARDEDVGLPLDRHDVLRVAALERLLVHRLALAREDAGDAVGRRHALEDRLARAPAAASTSVKESALKRRALGARPVVLVLVEELERPVEHAVVHRRLDVEDVRASSRRGAPCARRSSRARSRPGPCTTSSRASCAGCGARAGSCSRRGRRRPTCARRPSGRGSGSRR